MYLSRTGALEDDLDVEMVPPGLKPSKMYCAVLWVSGGHRTYWSGKGIWVC